MWLRCQSKMPEITPAEMMSGENEVPGGRLLQRCYCAASTFPVIEFLGQSNHASLGPLVHREEHDLPSVGRSDQQLAALDGLKVVPLVLCVVLASTSEQLAAEVVDEDE